MPNSSNPAAAPINPYHFVGKRVPTTHLAWMRDGEVRQMLTDNLFSGRQVLIIGVPGAFSPICSQRHVPDMVAQADKILAKGFSMIACITPNDPWVNEAWAREVDPQGKLTLFSDGNMEFVRKMGLTVETPRDLFMGERSQRYMLQLKDSIVERIGVERDILTVSCSSAEEIVIAA